MQTRKALELLSNGDKKYADRSSGLLEKKASKFAEMYDERERQIDAKRTAASVPAPFLETIRKKVSKVVDGPDPRMPVVTRFDLYTGVRRIAARTPADAGLKKLATQLERGWHSEPLGTLAYKEVNSLVSFYKDQYPKSKAASVIEAECSKSGLHKLPVAKLARIASSIRSQDDYDAAMVAHGLAGSRPEQVRARALVRDLVAMRSDAVSEGASSKKAPRNTRTAEQRVTDSLVSISANRTAQKFPAGSPQAVSKYRHDEYNSAYETLKSVSSQVDGLVKALEHAGSSARDSGVSDVANKVNNLASGLKKWKGSLDSISAKPLTEQEVNSYSTSGFMNKMKEKFNPFNRPDLLHQQDPNSSYDGSNINQRIDELHSGKPAAPAPAAPEQQAVLPAGNGTSLREREDAASQRGRSRLEIDEETPAQPSRTTPAQAKTPNAKPAAPAQAPAVGSTSSASAPQVALQQPAVPMAAPSGPKPRAIGPGKVRPTIDTQAVPTPPTPPVEPAPSVVQPQAVQPQAAQPSAETYEVEPELDEQMDESGEPPLANAAQDVDMSSASPDVAAQSPMPPPEEALAESDQSVGDVDQEVTDAIGPRQAIPLVELNGRLQKINSAITRGMSSEKLDRLSSELSSVTSDWAKYGAGFATPLDANIKAQIASVKKKLESAKSQAQVDGGQVQTDNTKEIVTPEKVALQKEYKEKSSRLRYLRNQFERYKTTGASSENIDDVISEMGALENEVSALNRQLGRGVPNDRKPAVRPAPSIAV